MEAHEHAEHAEHAAHEGNPLISQVTFTIAVLAVVAAICASLETTEGDKALGDKNSAVLEQNRATDIWNLYEAKSLKKNLYALAADQGGAKAAGLRQGERPRNAADQTGVHEAGQGVRGGARRADRGSRDPRAAPRPADHRLDPAAHVHRHRHPGDHPPPPLALVHRPRPGGGRAGRGRLGLSLGQRGHGLAV